MELLYRYEATLQQPTPIGPVPGGFRIDIPFDGVLVAGTLAGGRGWGVEYLMQRPDGVGAIDARDTFEIPGGHLHAQASGFVMPPPGVEPITPEALLRPGYEMPDANLTIHGFALCQTAVPEFEHLNRTLVRIDGWVNNATGELVLEGRALSPHAIAGQHAAGLEEAGLTAARR